MSYQIKKETCPVCEGHKRVYTLIDKPCKDNSEDSKLCENCSGTGQVDVKFRVNDRCPPIKYSFTTKFKDRKQLLVDIVIIKEIKNGKHTIKQNFIMRGRADSYDGDKMLLKSMRLYEGTLEYVITTEEQMKEVTEYWNELKALGFTNCTG